MPNFEWWRVNATPRVDELDQRNPPIWRERIYSSVNKEGVYRPWFSRG